ncbi:guanine nucleotide binding protein, alpha subunit [Scheffersomyces xylosifermentans]|uniref:guanine nucleotide binding protein, alpha subunit n=1 Tax=Scheffersomyces xylosifermentans TaxID=1304137 RepID=UPI00315D5852
MGSCTSKDPAPSQPSAGNTQARREGQRQALNSGSTGATTTSQNNNSTDSSNDVEKPPPTSSSNAVEAATQSDPNKESKVLLLGSGESGKSTIVKQMKILHQNGYTKEELYEFKPFVYKNILDCIKNIINAIIDLQPSLINKEGQLTITENGTTEQINSTEDDIPETADTAVHEFKGETYRKHILNYDDLNEVLDYEFSIDSEEVFNPEIAKKIKQIYNTPEVKNFIKHQQANFYLIDSTSYFLSDIDRITNPKYVPSVNDILRTRKKTSGIFDFKFQMSGGLNIHMYDVGGQRSERKKWIHCFDNVTLIIFCVALSEYDQVLLEENSQNRLEESLALFDSVVNSRWFARTSIVLFLNKIDVFADKLAYSPLEKQFPDYTGGNNINKAAKYILWRFTQVNRSGLNIYPHVTQATDTSNIQLVMAAVKETILENSLRDTGILQT